MSTEIDLAQVKRAAHNAVPLTYKTYTLPHETEIYLDKVLEAFLSELGQQKLKELGLYVKVVFQTRNRALTITVRNNVEITRKEQIRVFDRLARSRAFTSLEEAFATVLDNSEGAGLGIVILVLMMKKIGLTEGG